jgi:bacterioferritin
MILRFGFVTALSIEPDAAMSVRWRDARVQGRPSRRAGVRGEGGGRMRGNDQVIAQLNLALKEELTAINQYFLHAEMAHSWGYHRIGAYIKKQSIDEMKHAEKLIERLLFLDATPKMDYLDLSIGGNIRAQIESDLKLEQNAVGMYNNAIRIARDANDDASRVLFSELLKDEEEHVDWLEAQMHQINEMGYERYLSLQVEGPKD